jgi:exodeoxyribonuclease III
MDLAIATWNINSVRLRIDLVTRFLEEHKPDILCLQETKCMNGQFPHAPFRKLGYDHHVINGQKGYHGVAILSRLPLQEENSLAFCGKPDARHGAALVTTPKGLIRIHNFYVPAGGDIPDADANEKFAHKLGFLDEMREWGQQEKLTGIPTVLLGDLNVAPLENDVWSHKQMLKIVSHTPMETQRMLAAIADGGWVDAIRHLIPEPEKVYTWWSYRAADWAQSDRGRRLDHIWVTADLVPSLSELTILREARSWERPSDHVPVILHLQI